MAFTQLGSLFLLHHTSLHSKNAVGPTCKNITVVMNVVGTVVPLTLNITDTYGINGSETTGVPPHPTILGSLNNFLIQGCSTHLLIKSYLQVYPNYNGMGI